MEGDALKDAFGDMGITKVAAAQAGWLARAFALLAALALSFALAFAAPAPAYAADIDPETQAALQELEEAFVNAYEEAQAGASENGETIEDDGTPLAAAPGGEANDDAASPAEEDVDPIISGTWLEKDTQFTVLNIAKNPEGGWNLEFTSPVSHGAWVIRATAYHDCDYDAFVYADGEKFLLNTDGSIPDQAEASGLWGTLKFEASPSGTLLLTWYDMAQSEGETVTFVSDSSLPQ